MFFFVNKRLPRYTIVTCLFSLVYFLSIYMNNKHFQMQHCNNNSTISQSATNRFSLTLTALDCNSILLTDYQFSESTNI